MKLRDFLKEDIDFGILSKFIIGRFILVGFYSGKTRYDSEINSDKILKRYLDCEVERIDSEIKLQTNNNSFSESAIVIYITEREMITKEEEKAKHKEEKQK